MPSFLSIVVPLKNVSLDTSDYVLSSLGRVADEQKVVFKVDGEDRATNFGITGDRVIFQFEDISEVEYDRVKMMAGLHGHEIVQPFSRMVVREKDDLDSLFEVYAKGEAPVVEGRPPKLTKDDIEKIRNEIKEAVLAVSKPAAPAPVETFVPAPNYQVNFFGWCNEEGHDKVWGYVTVGGRGSKELYNFWGRRGKNLTFKQHFGTWGSDDLAKLAAQKVRPRSNGSYTEINPKNIENLIPGFFESFEKQLTLAKLFDKFHGKTEEDA